jgi:multidrug efflux pump subunit AcrA (membrane-fusion protein)
MKKSYDYEFNNNNPLDSFVLHSSTVVMLLIVVSLVYMIIYKIDIVTTAIGRVIPEGRIKIVQPLIGGKISAIHVQDGQFIEKGQVLLELDSTQYQHDLSILNQELESIERNIVTEAISSKRNIKYTESKVNNLKKLVKQRIKPMAELLELENKLQNKITEHDKYQHTLEKDRKNTIQNIKKLQYTIKNMDIISPISGYVENLKTCTIGGIITQGDNIMNIVPKDKELKLEANLQGKDIGFVKINQNVAIKLDAFPYTQYGTLKGKVCKIANDSSSSDGINYFYKIDICLNDIYLKKKGNKFKVVTGLTAQIDIYTDKRSIIDFFIDPIKTAISDSFKER